jgi:hypothetical protein
MNFSSVTVRPIPDPFYLREKKMWAIQMFDSEVKYCIYFFNFCNAVFTASSSLLTSGRHTCDVGLIILIVQRLNFIEFISHHCWKLTAIGPFLLVVLIFLKS